MQPGKHTVYEDRTWRLSEDGRVNAPAAAYQIVIKPSSSDKDDRRCLQYIAGCAAVRPTSGRYSKSCDQAAAWLQALVRCRAEMHGKGRNDWVGAAKFQSENTLGLLLCLRYSYKKVNRHRFQLMCANYGVHSALQLAPLVNDAMFDGAWSGIYQCFSFQQASVYHGKFHGSDTWCCWDRTKQHYGNIANACKGDEVQHMYHFMARRGGMESWFSLPVMRCPMIPKSQLDLIEQGYIKADPHCLNTQHCKGKGLAKGCASAKSVLEFQPRAAGFGVKRLQLHQAEHNPCHHPIPLNREIKAKRGCKASLIGIDPFVYVSDDGVGWKLCMDVSKAFSWRFVSIHSSRPMHNALITRLWGRSTVVRYNLKTGSTSVCLLKRCWNTLNDVAGRYIIHFITRHRHTPMLGDLDRHLLHIAKHDYGRSNEVYESLWASELWRLWMVSSAHCTNGVHKVNKQKIKRVLRRKGITLTPDSEIRIPCPPTVLVTKRELRMELKNQLKHSFIPDIICRSILRKAKFVKQSSVTIGDMLRNHMKLTAMLQHGDLPCV